LVSLLALWEYNNVILKETDRWSRFYGVIVGAMVVPVFYLGRPGAVLPYIIVSILVLFVNRFFYEREFAGAIGWTGARLLGIVYIAVPLGHLIVLRETELGPWWILFALTVIWANDTFAFFVGNLAGRHKLSPAISPNKTVEGAVGGLSGGVLGAILFNRFFNMGAGPFEVFYLSIVIGTLGILGDLVESLIKRGAGVKDTGNIIPGHGGVMDRVDSLLFAIPALYYYLIWRAGGF
jgi:phosphatidate cytidylyltransferase